MRRVLLLLFFLLAFSPVATASYEITEAELTTLENNLTQLQGISSESQQELRMLKKQLQASEADLTQLRNRLSELKQDSEQQEKLLQIANESLKQYEKEVRQKTRKMKFQRNLAWGCCLAALVIAIAR